MNANKITLHIELEALSVDVFPGLLLELETSLALGNTEGRLVKDDGDDSRWWTTSEDVEI